MTKNVNISAFKNFLKSTSMFQNLTTKTVAVLFFTTVPTFAVHAAPADNDRPTGGVVQPGGAASFTYSNLPILGPRLDIRQTSDRVVIDWDSFDIGKKATTNFIQNNSSSIAVNRVNNGNPTQILGRLTANGQVIIQNQNGVFFGSTSRVDVAGLLATTGKINTTDFMNGANLLSITDIGGTGSIVNQGNITVRGGGLAAFVAPHVRNDGFIQATLGRVALASGNKATVDLYGDGLISIAARDGLSNALVENSGTIEANGGVVALTVAAAEGVVDSAINMSGVIRAETASLRNGKIILGGTRGVKTTVSGDLSTNNLIGKGGEISITGQEVVLTGTADVNAGGTSGGGDIYIGGGVTADGTHIRTAETVDVEQGAEIHAGAWVVGNGGTINIHSNERTTFDGEATAKGGLLGGDGGFIETSSKKIVQVLSNALISASAISGQAGQWLVDPTDISLEDTSSGSSTGSVVDTNVIGVTLDNGTDVTVRTANGGTDLGDITVNDHINWNGSGSLKLDARNNIVLKKSIESGYTGGDGSDGALTLVARNSIFSDGFNGKRHFTTNSGDITFTARDGDIVLGGHNGRELQVKSSDGDIRLDAGNDIVLAGSNSDQNNATRVVSDNGKVTLKADQDIKLSAGSEAGSATVVKSGANDVVLDAGRNIHLATLPTGRPVRVEGTNVTLRSIGVTMLDGSRIMGNGGDVLVQNTGVFSGNVHNAITNTGSGRIIVNQNDGGRIQNVLNAVDSSGTTGDVIVRVGAGSYGEDLTIEKRLTLRSVAGAASTFINGLGASVASVLISASDVIFGGPSTSNGFTVTAANGQNTVQVENGSDNVRIFNNTLNVANGKTGVLATTDNDNLYVEDNTFGVAAGDNASAFVSSQGTSNGLRILGNTFNGDANNALIVNSTNSQIRDNTFTGKNADATVLLSEKTLGGNNGHNHFSGNTFNTQNKVHILLTGNATIMNPETFLTNNSFPTGYVLVSGPTVNSNEGLFGLIQGGVDHAADGATVTASAHTFTEQVVIDGKNITVRGQGKDQTIVAAPETMVQTSQDGSKRNYSVIQVKNADNVTIEDLGVDGSTNTNNVYNNNNRFVGIGYDEAGGTLQDTEIKNTGFAVLARSVSDKVLDVKNNIISGFQKVGIALSGRGLSGTVSDNELDGNTVGKTGILVAGNAQTDVVDNTISNVKTGIRINKTDATNADKLEVSGNTISSVRNGIAVNKSSYVDVIDNTITAKANGVNVRGSNNIEVSENTIDGVNHGITVRNSDLVTLDDNDIVGRTTALRLFNTSNSTISNHDLGGFKTVVLLDGVDNVTLDNNTLKGSDLGLGVFGQFNQLVTLLNNKFKNNDVGARFESGAIDFEGVNKFTNGTTGMIFDPGASNNPPQPPQQPPEQQPLLLKAKAPTGLSIVGNYLDEAVFKGQTGNYIELRNGALYNPGTPTIIDATDSTFNGVRGPVLNSFQRLAIQAKIIDYLDTNNTGLIFAGIEPNAADDDEILKLLGMASVAGEGGPTLRIRGLPFIPDANGNIPARAFANIAPAAGGEMSAAQLNDISTAAGGDDSNTPSNGSEVGCWGDVYGSFAGGNAETGLSFDANPSDMLKNQSSCKTQ